MANLWILHDVVARVVEGKVTLLIEQPMTSLPRKQAANVADKVWLKKQIDALNDARQRKLTVDIPLTYSPVSTLRMGGGFVHIETLGSLDGEKRLVIHRRDFEAPSRPGVFCEQAGVFDDSEKDPLVTFSKEIAELLRIEDGQERVLLVPLLMNGCATDTLLEHRKLAKAIGLSFVDTVISTLLKTAELTNAISWRFGVDRLRTNTTLSFEVDTSSIELCELMLSPLPGPNVTYFDGECFEKDGQLIPLHREIHRIDLVTGHDEVWQKGKIIRVSNIADEVAKIDRAKTDGLVATGKLQEVIKGLPFEAPGLAPLLS
jgi:hypothetical protein